MALLFVDGFDDTHNYGGYTWSNAKHNPYNVASAGVNGESTSATQGRRGGGCIQPILNAQYWQTSIAHLATPNTVIIGYAWKENTTPVAGSGYRVMAQFYEFNAGVGITHVQIRMMQDFTFEIWRGDGTALLYTTAAQTQCISGTWYYFECKVHIDDSPSGTVELRVDGRVIANITDDTNNAGTTKTIQQIRIAKIFSMSLVAMDDYYICDNSGSANNDFLGDVRVDTLWVTADGATNDFTPSAGSNYQNVDEKPPDGDTTYNSSSTVGHIDLYAMGDLSHNPAAIYGVQVVQTITREDGVLREVQALIRSGTTNYDSGGVVALQDRYVGFCSIEEVDPDTGVAWTQSGVNAAQAGVEVIT